ncbi:hypothetical protein [Paractinoplanes durhamensis]|uniref:Uncharacterized protein n=1 Tax=Paractinoplanes durhamensis TaxID=113563 RepID=A0ABQ3Z029_9ACTN|nr:hypothetical protein [Actinoplanes durhamensis]GIE03173.1 hypothetical protein Adu01nite_45230 [Actinoplanes durhamensis]
MQDVLLDPSAAHPELGALRSAFAARDWAGCRAVLDAATPGGRTWLMQWTAGDGGDAGFLRPLAGADPVLTNGHSLAPVSILAGLAAGFIQARKKRKLRA